jgi:hypothetical protein
MKGLSDDSKILLERVIKTIKNSISFEEVSKEFLTNIGVEAKVEHIISYFVGYLYGCIVNYYSSIYRRKLSMEEKKEFAYILKKRMPEIRESFMQKRIK